MNEGYFVGIDVSKETLDLSVVQGNQQIFYLHIANSVEGLKQFFKTCPKDIDLGNAVFCMEHTGIYTFYAIEYLMSKKKALWIESASKIKKSLGLQRGKNDKVDAFRIAQYAFKNRDEIKLWEPPREQVKSLKKLLSMRNRCVNLKKIAQVPLKENAGFSNREDVKLESKLFAATIKAIKQDLARIDKTILELITGDEYMKRVFELVTSVEGVGTIVAANMIVFTNEFKSFSSAKKFACYSGIAPFEHSSGKSIRGKSRVSHLANKSIKTLFHLAAISSIRFAGELRTFYLRKVNEGKNKMLVLNAIRNKLVHRIFAVVRDGVPYHKNYSHPLQVS
jgi:transposase